jgi:nicotinamidase-related amidase
VKKWQSVFKSMDRSLAKKAGFGQRQAYGERPALLVIDVNRAFLGSVRKPALESVSEYRTSCGSKAWKSLGCVRKLVEACRASKVPVVFTTNDATVTKHSRGPDKIWGPGERLDSKSQEIVDEVKPLPSELVLRKTKASAFFATPLVPTLLNMKVDSVFVVGCTTSGCVRATVVDAVSYNFRAFVVEDCTFDRFELSHLVSLWDMHMKYADVISLREALAHISCLRDGGSRENRMRNPVSLLCAKRIR